MRYFLAVARAGSLSAAARALGVEHSTVARRVAGLETRVGLRLFDRLPRSWLLTPEGEALLPPAERLESEAHAFGRAASAATAARGVVRLSAPPTLASHVLLPGLAARAQRWRGIALDLIGEVRTANLFRREADIALRLARPEEPGLSARLVGKLPYGLYAAPAWRRRAARSWCFLGYREPLDQVPQQRALAEIAGDRPFVLRSNDLPSLHRACRAGLGIAMLPAFLADEDAGLVPIPHAATPVLRELWLAVHPDVRRSPRVRRMVDLLVEVTQEACPV